MNESDLIGRAIERTGLDNFGNDSWKEGFAILVDSLDKEARLNALGEATVSEGIVRTLSNRLQVEDWYLKHPEIADQKIAPPVFGLGLPRTSSTALRNMLALDPARRSLRNWEAEEPCPPPDPATDAFDPRIAPCEARVTATSKMFPDFANMLPVSATGPVECAVLLTLEFRSTIYSAMGHIPTYIEYALTCDMESAYRYHERILKLLQWRYTSPRWSLGTPGHCLVLPMIDLVYPGSRFIMTHRDVTKVIPSTAALRAELSSPLTYKPDFAFLGANVVRTWEDLLKRALAFRDAGNEDRFFDIHFREFQQDPLLVIKRLYEWLGDDLSEEAERRMMSWWEKKAENRQPSKGYKASDYGLDEEDLRQRFDFYNARFAEPVPR